MKVLQRPFCFGFSDAAPASEGSRFFAGTVLQKIELFGEMRYDKKDGLCNLQEITYCALTPQGVYYCLKNNDLFGSGRVTRWKER